MRADRPSPRARIRRALAAVGLLAACARPGAPPAPVAAPAVAGAVASAHPEATRVGVEVLEAGGNAFDAAVATAFALAVVEPYSSGLGGGGFALLASGGTDEVRVLDFRERAPGAAHRDLYVGPDGRVDSEASRTGGLAVGVPGEVAGLIEILEERGSWPLERVVEPARRLAAEGFAVDAKLAERIEGHRDLLARFPGSRAVFLPGGRAPLEGERLRQPGLARTLARIAEQGRAGFYAGPVAEAIAEETVARGGILTADDLAAYTTRWLQPVEGRYRGYRVVSMPPPSSGGALLVHMLRVLELLDAGAYPAQGPRRLHLLAETMRRAYADRAEHLGDPDFVSVPTAWLASEELAEQRAGEIDPSRATPSSEVAPAVPPLEDGPHTTHLSVADGHDNLVSMTLTINTSFGSGVTVPGWGIVLNDEMDDFSISPGVPNAYGLVGAEANAVAAGKTPLSSMSPTLVYREGRPYAVLGSPGGPRIISTVLQVLMALVDDGLPPEQAVATPRVHHQWKPDLLYVEDGPSPDARTLAALEALGHEIERGGHWSNAQILVREASGWRPASDPRGVGLGQVQILTAPTR